jgi:glycosyltransferase involved in cell wall biosynthesis
MVTWIQDASANGQAVGIDYHNITPAEYFRRWDPGVAEQMVEARQELAALAKSTRLALADSEYNASELRHLGCAGVKVAPLLLNLASYRVRPNRMFTASLSRRKARSGSWWLFVGRAAPNKCQHDVIAAFAVYRRHFDRRARLALIGSPSPLKYRQALQRLAADLEVSDAVEFHGALPFARLLAYYRAADVFVCMSEHEGFCVPIIEAMELGVPVVAFDAAAVGETVGDAGVLVQEKDPAFVAAEVHGLLSDAGARSEAVKRGRTRARDYALASTTPRFLAALSEWRSASP